ncbi:hypothetical protein L596_028350 [Steinernema carpocapsae]|uniref:Tetraspanin n=1 Tax=Steinernema carpocapsae TaxID=34508 RepID=A0A4U5LY82_STECR|nr:hypothetical protein L596_028350 [Steinernema carpocapsae]
MQWPTLTVEAHAGIAMFACMLHFLAFVFGLLAFGFNTWTFFVNQHGLAYIISLSSYTKVAVFPYLQVTSGFWALLTTPLQTVAVCFHLDQRHRKTRWAPRSIKYFQYFGIYAAFLVTAPCLAMNMAYWFRFEKSMGYGIADAMSKYIGESIDVKAKENLDWLQMHFQCCGLSGPEDYIWLPWSKKALKYANGHEVTHGQRLPTCFTNATTYGPSEDAHRVKVGGCYIPFSCCRRDNLECSGWIDVYRHSDILAPEIDLEVFYNDHGCVEAVKENLKTAFSLILMGCFLALQLLGNLASQVVVASPVKEKKPTGKKKPDSKKDK